MIPIANAAQATPFTMSKALSCHRNAIPANNPVPIQDDTRSYRGKTPAALHIIPDIISIDPAHFKYHDTSKTGVTLLTSIS